MILQSYAYLLEGICSLGYGLLTGELFTKSAKPVCSTRAIFVKEINNPSENEAGKGATEGGKEGGEADGQTRTKLRRADLPEKLEDRYWPESHEESGTRN